MRALQYTEHGGPEVLKWEDAPTPHAGAGQIRIAVRAASVNPLDWKQVTGAMSGGEAMSGTAYLGFDAAGVVDEVGEGVTGVSAGDEVFGRGQNTQAEYAVLDAWAVKAPSVDWAVAAPALPVKPPNAVCACLVSKLATTYSSTVAPVAWEPSTCRWRSREERRWSPRPARPTATTCGSS